MILTKSDIKHRVLAVNINRLYKEGMNRDELYDVVRGIWIMAKDKTDSIDYVCGIYKMRIVAVFRPTQWFVYGDAPNKMRRNDLELSEKNRKRFFFVDDGFEQGHPMDKNEEFYCGKSIEELIGGKATQNPVRYLLPEQGKES